MVGLLAYLMVGRMSSGLETGSEAFLDDKIHPLGKQAVSLKSVVGNKIAVINFWASWCPPCRQELPVLSKLAKEYAKKNVVFIGAAVNSPKGDILELKNQYSLTYFLGSIDSAALNRWQAEALPTTYIIDKSGKIAWYKSGQVSEDMLRPALEMVIKNSRTK